MFFLIASTKARNFKSLRFGTYLVQQFSKTYLYLSETRFDVDDNSNYNYLILQPCCKSFSFY